MKSGSAELIDPPPARLTESDSRAHTHPENDRSFFAWLHTGWSLNTVAIATAGLLPGDPVPGFPIGGVLAILIVLTVTAMAQYGVNQYVRASRRIDPGSSGPTLAPLEIAAATIGLLGILAMPVVRLLR